MNITLIFKYYWPHIKKYKKSVPLVFLSYGLAVASTTIVTPLLYRKIIDTVVSSPDPSTAGAVLVPTLLLLGGAIFIYNGFFRMGDYSIYYAQSHLLKDIADDAFQRLQYHSYDFFTSTFIGALVARTKRYVHAFEAISDYIIFAVWWSALRLIFIFAVLIWIAPILAGVFFVWLVLYVGLTSRFVRKKMVKDLLATEANSRMTATLADALTNALNVKIFASQKREEILFEHATHEEEVLRRDSWRFQGFQYAFQGYFIGLFEFLGMSAAVILWMSGHISAGTIVLMQVYILSSFDTKYGT